MFFPLDVGFIENVEWHGPLIPQAPQSKPWERFRVCMQFYAWPMITGNGDGSEDRQETMGAPGAMNFY